MKNKKKTVKKLVPKDGGGDLQAIEEIEWDLDKLIGPEPKFEQNKCQEALLKTRKLKERELFMYYLLAEDLEDKLNDMLGKLVGKKRVKIRSR
jgi:hypothetical protein